MKKILFLLFLITFNSYSQDLNTFYTSFSSENPREHILRFLNDSNVQFQNVPTHRSKIISFKVRYFKENENIIIDIKNLTETERSDLKIFNLDYLENLKIILNKNKSELVDRENQTVYVKQNILNTNRMKRKAITVIDSERLIVDRGITNSYGLIEKMPKGNRKLTKFMVKNASNPKYKTKIIRGLKAYEEYGILGVNGVCIVYKTE